jgi:hypothetical protein
MQQLGRSENPEVVKAQSAVETTRVLMRQAEDARIANLQRWRQAHPGESLDIWDQTPDAIDLQGQIERERQAFRAAQDRLRQLSEQFPSPTSDAVDAAIRAARNAGPEGSPERAAALKDLVAKYGGDPDLIDHLLEIRGADASESAWAIKENIVAANARKAGHDAVVALEDHPPSPHDIVTHPDYVAAENALLAARQMQDEAARAYGRNGSPETLGAYSRAQEQARSAFSAAQQTEQRLRQELSRPRIQEVMDVREAANPTPGAPIPRPSPRPRSQRAEKEYVAARDAYAESDDSRCKGSGPEWYARQSATTRAADQRMRQAEANFDAARKSCKT